MRPLTDVLIVDASLVVRTLARSFVERALTTLGRVREAATLEEARKAVRVRAPDVVLLDPVLPDGPGVGLLLPLAAVNPNAKVVLVTSLGRADPVVVEAIGAGALACIHKPLRYPDLCDAFRECDVPLLQRIPVAGPEPDRRVFRGLPPR